jgi:hypothetical protein
MLVKNMYKLIIGENTYEFEKWEDLQEFIYLREKSLRHRRKSKAVTKAVGCCSDTMIYKIETKDSFTITFDEC